jgi:hypothetical protein
MFKTPLLLGLLISAISILGCGEDDPVREPPTYCPLFDCDPINKELVLANLEASYNRKNIAKFDALLDSDFVFFFSPPDVAGGAPAQWGRSEEMYLTTRLFDVGLQQGVWRFDVNIQFETGVQWVDVIPAAFPDEVWYTATVPYEFFAQFESREAWVTSSGAQAQFTVRNTGTDSDPVWKLVEWRDIGITSPPVRAFEIYKTWGGFKASFIPSLSSP